MLGGGLQTIKKNAEALVVARKGTKIEANVDKSSTWSCPRIIMQDVVTV
jgi:hypothetical protein